MWWCVKGKRAMAICGFDVRIISRGSGHSVTAAAAYRAGERIVDKRTGEVHDYRRRSGVSGTTILAPAGAAPWTRDRVELWNRVESNEARCDAQLARHWLLVLPRELDAETNKQLALTFYRRYVVSRGIVVDVAFHDLDGPNPHCHGLGTLRELAGDGFAARKNRTWNAKDFVVSCRKGWATLGNEFLARANVGQEQWIDHRTLEAQRQEALLKCDYERALRLCRLPTRHLGKAATAILARGGSSTRAEDLAEETRAAAPEVARMRREVELHQEQVAQLRGEQELERRLEDRWREKAERAERERKARIEGIAAKPGGLDLFEGKLDDLDPRWRDRDEPRVPDIDTALTHAETQLAQIEAERQRLEEQRRTDIEQREAEVRATKRGQQWLLKARRQVLKGADRVPTLDEHEHIAEMAWGGIRADLDRQKESLVATETGAQFLRAAQQERRRGATTTTLESEEQLLDRVELQLRDHVANERRTALQQELIREPGGRDLCLAHLADIDPAWSPGGKIALGNFDAALDAAASDAVRLTQLRDVLKDPADAANYRAALVERGERFTVEDIDAALAAARRQREAAAAARQQEENALKALESETEKRQTEIKTEARAAGLDEETIGKVFDEAEAQNTGSGWTAVESATEARVERRKKAEDSARAVGVDVDAVMGKARARLADPLTTLESVTTKRQEEITEAARTAGLDDSTINSVYLQGEQRQSGAGYREIESATAERVERRSKAEDSARAVGLDIDAVMTEATAARADPLTTLESVTTKTAGGDHGGGADRRTR